MAAKIYVDGNYIIKDDGVNPELDYPKVGCHVTERDGNFKVIDTKNKTQFVIEYADVVNYKTDIGELTAYTEATFRTFIRANTATTT